MGKLEKMEWGFPEDNDGTERYRRREKRLSWIDVYSLWDEGKVLAQAVTLFVVSAMLKCRHRDKSQV